MTDKYVAAGNLYKLSTRELWRFTRSPLQFLIALIRFRLFRPASTYSVAFSELPTTGWTSVDRADVNFRDQLQDFADEARSAGLVSPVCNINRIIGPAQGAISLHRSPDGRFYAVVIIVRSWETGALVEETASACITPMNDGTFLVTSGCVQKFDNPPGQHAVYYPGASLSELIGVHRQRLDTEIIAQPQSVDTDGQMVDYQLKLEKENTDFQLERGVYVLLTDEEAGALRSVYNVAEPADETNLDFVEAEILDVDDESGEQIERSPLGAELVEDVEHDMEDAAPGRHGVILNTIRQQSQANTSWSSNLILLFVSVVGFTAAGLFNFDWTSLLWLLVVLFIHELGHFVAMRTFGYRDVRMFFVPFFGAAVSGRNYNASGWKRAVVALAGPLPGIVIGTVLLFIPGLPLESQDVAYMFLGLNVFNLLPVLPLDGGHVVHSVISSRSRYLDVCVRTLSPVALGVLAWLLNSLVLGAFAFINLIAIPIHFKLGGITARLRRERLGVEEPLTENEGEIPVSTSVRIIEEIDKAIPNQPPKNVASFTVQVYEALRSRPPGVFASCGILASYLGGFLLPIAAMVVWIMANRIGPERFPASPVVSITSTGVNAVAAGPTYQPEEFEGRLFIVCEEEVAAAKTMDTVTELIGPEDSARQFDKLIFINVADPSETIGIRHQLKFMGIETYESDSMSFGIGMSINLSVGEMNDTGRHAWDQFQAYAGAHVRTSLIPPWHPHLEVTQKHQENRLHLEAVQQFLGQLDVSPDVRALYDKADALIQDESEPERATEDLYQQAAQLKREHRASSLRRAIEDGTLPGIPSEFIDGYLNQMRTNEKENEDGRPGPNDKLTLFELSLGSIPPDSSWPVRRYQSLSDHQQDDALQSAASIRFVDPSAGLPAAVRWLEENGCEDIRVHVPEYTSFAHMFDLQADPGDL